MRKVKNHLNQGKYVAAICASPAVVLQHHDLLKGVHATCHPSVEDILKKANNFKDASIVHEKNISTQLHRFITFYSYIQGTRHGNGFLIVLGWSTLW